jgi:hypothetical protein
MEVDVSDISRWNSSFNLRCSYSMYCQAFPRPPRALATASPNARYQLPTTNYFGRSALSITSQHFYSSIQAAGLFILPFFSFIAHFWHSLDLCCIIYWQMML